MPAADVLVIGGGIIGLACAYHLARAGAQVAVAEREAPGAGASGAAAGMLGAVHEAEADSPMYRLCVQSRDLWARLALDLLAETGIDPELVNSGTLTLARTPAEADRLQGKAAWVAAAGQEVRWLEEAAVQARVPGAAPIHGALLAPADGHVQPPRAVQALQRACARRGVTFHPGAPVLALRTAGRRVTGAETAAGPLTAGTTVLAAGAHSRALAAPLGVHLPVFPVKGQILSLLPDGPGAGTGPWTDELTTLFTHGCYLVPKRDGRIIVGATEEPEAGFDRRVTLGAVTQLGQAAAALVPALARAPLAATWSGLRPATPDRRPVLGPLPGWEGVLAATGHFRNGVLLAPVTGEIIAALCAGGRPPADLAPFAPGRFT